MINSWRKNKLSLLKMVLIKDYIKYKFKKRGE